MLFALALASVVAAEPAVMALPQVRRNVLEPRQTIPGFSDECASALSGVVGSVPTPPPRLVSELIGGDGASQTDPCSVSVPDSLSSEYSSYSSELYEWYGSSSDDLSSAFSQCPELSTLSSLVPVCGNDITGSNSETGTTTVPLTNSAGSTTGSSTMTADMSDMTSSSGTSTDSEDATDASSDSNPSATEDGGEGAAIRGNGRVAAVAGLVMVGVVAAFL